GQLYVAVSKSNVTLSKINDSLRHLDEEFFVMMSDVKGDQLKKQISELKQLIDKLEDDLRKQQQDPGILETLDKVVKCGKAIGELVAAIYSEDVIAIASALKNSIDTFQSLNAGAQPSVGNLPQLKAQLADLELRFDQLVRFVADKKQEYLAKQYSDLIE